MNLYTRTYIYVGTYSNKMKNLITLSCCFHVALLTFLNPLIVQGINKYQSNGLVPFQRKSNSNNRMGGKLSLKPTMRKNKREKESERSRERERAQNYSCAQKKVRNDGKLHARYIVDMHIDCWFWCFWTQGIWMYRRLRFAKKTALQKMCVFFCLLLIFVVIRSRTRTK